MGVPERAYAADLYEVIRFVRPVHRVLQRAVEAALDGTRVTVGMRAVLEVVVEGPRTVPEVARHLDIQRQFVQRATNGLLELGLVERRANPAHKRSPHIASTAKGRGVFEQIRAKENAPLDALGADLPLEDVRAAQRVRAAITARFASAAGGELAPDAPLDARPTAPWPAPPPRRRRGQR